MNLVSGANLVIFSVKYSFAAAENALAHNILIINILLKARAPFGEHELSVKHYHSDTYAPGCSIFRRKLSMVFSMRQVMVIGPTPPGTGVITDAFGSIAA